MSQGIDVRHSRGCKSRAAGRCDCTPTFQAWVFDARAGRKIRKTFAAKGAAKTWRQDMLVALRRGEVTAAGTTLTVDEAVKSWVHAAERGTVRTRGRNPFAAGTIRSVEQNYRLRLQGRFGRRRLDRLSLLDLQEWVDELDGDGVHPSTIETSVLPLRLAYRRAKGKGEVMVDPTDGLELPQKPVRGTSRTPPSAEGLLALLEAVPDDDRVVWATFMFAGLRRGELLGLRWSDVDLEGRLLHVEQQYALSDRAFKPTKGRRQRKVPMSATLAGQLREHRLRSGLRDGLVFGAGVAPLDSRSLQRRADASWAATELGRVTPHVCRHLYATLMAAAAVPLHALSRFMGHSSIAVTFDNYGHLFPGDEAQAATLQDVYLDRASAAGRASS